MTGRLIRTLLDIMRLRGGPQDLPAGWPLAAGISLAYIVQGMYIDRIVGEPDGAPRSLLAIGFQFGVVAVLLNLRNLASRLPQTLLALAGTGFIFGLLAALVLVQIEPGRPQPELALLYLGLFGWSLIVDANIYRHALSLKMGVGVLLAVLIFGANFILLRTVFG